MADRIVWRASTACAGLAGAAGPFPLQAGFHVSRRIRAPFAKAPAAGRTLRLKLGSVAGGQVVFSAERTRVRVVDPAATAAVVFAALVWRRAQGVARNAGPRGLYDVLRHKGLFSSPG
jgi:hypothetical protein